MDEQLAGAKELYERAIFNGEYDVLSQADRELDAVEAALLIGRGRVMHGRYLETRIEVPEELPAFERAADLYPPWATSAARPKPSSGSAASTRSSGTTTRPPSQPLLPRASWPGRPGTN